MECEVRIEKDTVVVSSDIKANPLRMNINKSYCRLFESTRDQSRDYVEEVVRWCGDYPANFDSFSRNLMLYTAAQRKQFGFER